MFSKSHYVWMIFSRKNTNTYNIKLSEKELIIAIGYSCMIEIKNKIITAFCICLCFFLLLFLILVPITKLLQNLLLLLQHQLHLLLLLTTMHVFHLPIFPFWWYHPEVCIFLFHAVCHSSIHLHTFGHQPKYKYRIPNYCHNKQYHLHWIL